MPLPTLGQPHCGSPPTGLPDRYLGVYQAKKWRRIQPACWSVLLIYYILDTIKVVCDLERASLCWCVTQICVNAIFGDFDGEEEIYKQHVGR
jgi:hypothetical protein